MDKDGRREPIWVPAELCDIIPGSARMGKLTRDETTNMINIACNRPAINAKCLLEEGLPTLGFSAQRKAPILASFGIEISDKMSEIPARILLPPKLSYGNKPVTARNGAWNILDIKFLRGAKVSSYWGLYVKDDSVSKKGPPPGNMLTQLADAFRNKCTASGMDFQGKRVFLTADLNSIQGDDFARTKALRHIQEIIEMQKAKTGKPGFILVLLRGVDKYIYPGIKVSFDCFDPAYLTLCQHICDSMLGIHTVHMQLDKALEEKRQDQYLSNVALKVNTKLGGINHKVGCSQRCNNTE